MKLLRIGISDANLWTDRREKWDHLSMRTFAITGKALSLAALGVVVVGSWAMAVAAQQSNLPLEPQKQRGTSITPAYEGWYPNTDGTFTILLGYYNRNAGQTLEIPVGPNNKIEPGNPDQGQPTFFETGRQWGVFGIKVPKDFGTKSFTWTIVSNGEAQSIPFSLNKAYSITPFKELGMGNEPPVLAFSQGGAKVTGPPVGIAATLTGQVNQPVTLSVWAEDPKGSDTAEEAAAPAAAAGTGRGRARSVATVSLHKYRGPGDVKFEKARLPVAKQGDMVSTTATFSAAGDYIVRVQANDESGEGGGGFQCCWTNAHVKVTIR